MLIAIIGANGFLGRAFCKEALKRGHRVRAILRKFDNSFISDFPTVDPIISGDICFFNQWQQCFDSVSCIVHFAGSSSNISQPVDGLYPNEYYLKYHIGNERLFSAAIAANVRRFIFISSIKVNGEYTRNDCFTFSKQPELPYAFSASIKPNPSTPYARSKALLETALKNISKNTSMELVIVRPPMVYGKEFRGNLEKLKKVILSRVPLPFSLLHQNRAIISVENMADFLSLCLDHPKAAGHTFLIRDTEEISTYRLIKLLALVTGVKPLVFPFPVFLLRQFAKIFGLTREIESLCLPLRIEDNCAEKVLGWKPRHTIKSTFEVTCSHESYKIN